MISGGLRPKVRRTERLQTGVQPPFMYSTSQSPERATDSLRHAFCHPFGVLFYLYPLRRGCTPACVMSSPSGTFFTCGYQRPKGPTHSQPRAMPWAFEAPSVSDNRRHQPVPFPTGIKKSRPLKEQLERPAEVDYSKAGVAAICLLVLDVVACGKLHYLC